MSSSAIQLENVSLVLKSGEKSVHVLRQINLHIETGEKVALVGPSGSGKTSLLTLIAGLQPSTQGSVSILGRSIGHLSEEELAKVRRENIGIVFQSFHLIPSMTAKENVALPMELSGKANVGATADEALDAVGLANRRTHYPHQLSGGEQQRVAIARAFVNHPKILLADEPTGNLDIDTGRMVLDTILKLITANRSTLLFVTHDSNPLRFFDRVVSIRGGGIEKNNA